MNSRKGSSPFIRGELQSIYEGADDDYGGGFTKAGIIKHFVKVDHYDLDIITLHLVQNDVESCDGLMIEEKNTWC